MICQFVLQLNIYDAVCLIYALLHFRNSAWKRRKVDFCTALNSKWLTYWQSFRQEMSKKKGLTVTMPGFAVYSQEKCSRSVVPEEKGASSRERRNPTLPRSRLHRLASPGGTTIRGNLGFRSLRMWHRSFGSRLNIRSRVKSESTSLRIHIPGRQAVLFFERKVGRRF